MTFEDGDYKVTVIVEIPDDKKIDGYTATRMWLTELAGLNRQAALEDERDGWFWSAKLHRETAGNIDKVVEAMR